MNMYGETGFNFLNLGETLDGTDDDGNLINAAALGTIKTFNNLTLTGTGVSSVKTRKSSGPVYAVLLRNLSGGALTGKKLALCKQTHGGYSLIESVSGYTTTLYDKPCVAIDPWLPTAGVAANDIFWGIFFGPTILTLPSSGSDILASATPGTPLVASADNAGRPTPVAADPGSSALAYQAATSVFGTSLTTFTNAATDQEISVQMHCPWFPC